MSDLNLATQGYWAMCNIGPNHKYRQNASPTSAILCAHFAMQSYSVLRQDRLPQLWLCFAHEKNESSGRVPVSCAILFMCSAE